MVGKRGEGKLGISFVWLAKLVGGEIWRGEKMDPSISLIRS